MFCKWMKMSYLETYYEPTLEFSVDVADRNQGGLTG